MFLTLCPILFSIVGFTAWSASHTPVEVFKLLETLVRILYIHDIDLTYNLLTQQNFLFRDLSQYATFDKVRIRHYQTHLDFVS